MGGLTRMFGGQKSQPALLNAAQLATVERQEAAVKQEEERLAARQTEEDAAKRARVGRQGGRALLLHDEIGLAEMLGG